MLDMLPEEYYTGFITGVSATLLGFALTALWDVFKGIRDKSYKDKAILKLLKHEIHDNIDALRSNKKILDDELDSLKKKSSYVTPLMPLQESMWQIIALNMPAKLSKNSEYFDLLRISLLNVRNVIEVMRSRESYRLNNANMSNYSERMRIYDETLSGATQEVIKVLEAAEQYL